MIGIYADKNPKVNFVGLENYTKNSISNSNCVDKTPKKDTVTLSDKNTPKKVGIGAAVVAVAVGVFWVLRGKKLPKNLINNQDTSIVNEPVGMQMTENARKIYNDIASKLNKKTVINSETVDKNLAPINKSSSWDSKDMKEFYTKLEKESDSVIASEKTANEIKSVVQDDIVNFNIESKSSEDIINIVVDCCSKGKDDIAKKVLAKAIELDPANPVYYTVKANIEHTSAIAGLTKCIELNPTSCQAYYSRATEYLETGNFPAAVEDLKTYLKFAKEQNVDSEVIAEVEKAIAKYSEMPKTTSEIIKAQKLEPLKLTPEQIDFNKTVDEYMSKFEKEINEFFETLGTYKTSNTNCKLIQISPRDYLLNSIKKVGTLEDFGMKKDQIFYHGTTPEISKSIRKYGFDVSKNTRYESGNGAYFTLDKKAIEKAGYGDAIVCARFKGDKIAQVTPGVFEEVRNGSALRFDLAEKLGLLKESDYLSKEAIERSDKIMSEICNRYYEKLLQERNISGLYVSYSDYARCRYFVAINPLKTVEIL